MSNSILKVPPKLSELECEHGFLNKDGKEEWLLFGSDTGKTKFPSQPLISMVGRFSFTNLVHCFLTCVKIHSILRVGYKET